MAAIIYILTVLLVFIVEATVDSFAVTSRFARPLVPYGQLVPCTSTSALAAYGAPAEYSKLGKRLSDVAIESPSLNTRRITASIIIDCPMTSVWSILTDYNNLATHVPNLVKSYLVPSPPKTIRLFQEGAQKIIGFDFRASLTMDMEEEQQDPESDTALHEWNLRFKLIESRMFDAFDGLWSLRPHSRTREIDPATNQPYYRHNTKLTYSVFVRPRGPVPVMALEWRIKEDIPVNLYAVKVAAEQVYKQMLPKSSQSSTQSVGITSFGATSRWEQDETLESYLDDSDGSTNSSNSSSDSAAQARPKVIIP